MMEFYIIGQQVRDNDTVSYMDKIGSGQIDSSISFINKLSYKINEIIAEINLYKAVGGIDFTSVKL